MYNCICICSRSENGDGSIVGTLVVSSTVKTDVNWSLRMLAFSILPLWLFLPLDNGATNDHKRLGFDFMSLFNIVLT